MCLPAYRAEPYLRETIESVLAQNHQDWELIVVDNASPDRTGEIARSYDDPRIIVHTNDETIGLADNWNLAVDKATGRYVKVLPADDLLRPDCLELQAKQLETNPDIALVSCRRDFIDGDSNVVLRGRGLVGLLGEHQSAEVVRLVMRSGINPIGEPAAMMFRRADFLTAGPFDASFPFPMDLELSIRLLRHGNFYGQAQSLAAFRVRGDSLTGTSLGAQGAEHRALLRRIASDDHWSIPWAQLYRGLALTRVAVVKRRLLFKAVAHRWGFVRRLPTHVLDDALLAEAVAEEDSHVELI